MGTWSQSTPHHSGPKSEPEGVGHGAAGAEGITGHQGYPPPTAADPHVVAAAGYTWRALTRSPRVAKKILLLLVVVAVGLLIAKQFAAREH
jgi:hypothetical protein